MEGPARVTSTIVGYNIRSGRVDGQLAQTYIRIDDSIGSMKANVVAVTKASEVVRPTVISVDNAAEVPEVAMTGFVRCGVLLVVVAFAPPFSTQNNEFPTMSFTNHLSTRC